MSTPVEFACDCGKLRGELDAKTLKAATRVVCHCDDCRAFHVAVGRPDPGAADGVDILQLAPAGMRLTQGVEHLAALRLSPKGLVRWYASCCDTPLAATMPNNVVPFAGLLTGRLTSTERLGRVQAHGFLRNARGEVRHQNIGRLVRGMLSRTVAAYVSGRAKQTPFRDPESGDFIVEPMLVDRARRDEIYARRRRAGSRTRPTHRAIHRLPVVLRHFSNVRSICRPATVDKDRGAGDHRGGVRGEEQNRAHHVFDRRDPR
ncbi:hypothetical protein HKCCE4037_14970 [Rhodobacterales bacterium HKCCE4037]|nr:hypothetical protein [Rhodobacterales bacterium HKCCE4037]